MATSIPREWWEEFESAAARPLEVRLSRPRKNTASGVTRTCPDGSAMAFDYLLRTLLPEDAKAALARTESIPARTVRGRTRGPRMGARSTSFTK